MSEPSLSDTEFFIFGESKIVASAIEAYLAARKARVHIVTHLDEVRASDDTANVLVAHYNAVSSLSERLTQLKKNFTSFRILLLHEFIDRGKIAHPILSVTDHLLEKPFTRLSLDKALSQFHFRPLAQKVALSCSWGKESLATRLLNSLGATVYEKLPQNGEKPAFELAVFSPVELGGDFHATLKAFRNAYADVPVFMIYDPEIQGILNSAILNEVAYLLQEPVQKKVLREKILNFFEQPQRDRRKNPRKRGISQVWISAYNAELNAPELFESPALVDVSQSGLSFQSHTEYREGQLMAVWLVAEENPDKILDLRAQVRWCHKGDGDDYYKYGIEFTKEKPEVYDNFARMIAMHLG